MDYNYINVQPFLQQTTKSFLKALKDILSPSDSYYEDCVPTKKKNNKKKRLEEVWDFILHASHVGKM